MATLHTKLMQFNGGIDFALCIRRFHVGYGWTDLGLVEAVKIKPFLPCRKYPSRHRQMSTP